MKNVYGHPHNLPIEHWTPAQLRELAKRRIRDLSGDIVWRKALLKTLDSEMTRRGQA